MKYTLYLADICLPDYWGGHHLPVVQIPITSPMTIAEVREALDSEIKQTWEYYEDLGVDMDALVLAAQEIRNQDDLPDDFLHFMDSYPPSDDVEEINYAYFIVSELN